MFDPAFYAINKHFDSNLTSYTNFDPAFDYLLRFVVDGWDSGKPSGSKLLEAARAVAKILPGIEGLKPFEVKAVTFAKVPSGDKVGFYSPSWYSVAWGDGYTGTTTAGSATWTMDLVFRPKIAERKWTSVSKWKQALAGSLIGTLGTPIVEVCGLFPFDLSVTPDESAVGTFLSAATFWPAIQPYWEAYPQVCKDCETGMSGEVRKINSSATSVAWNRAPNFVGHDGFGVAFGSALHPHLLTPAEVESTITGGGQIVVPGLPEDALPKLPTIWERAASLPTQEKLMAGAAGAAILIAIAMAYQARRDSYDF